MMAPTAPPLRLLLEALERGELDPLAGYALPYVRAFVLVAPTVSLVPALSPRGLPAAATVRAALTLALALPIVGALVDRGEVGAAVLAVDLARGAGLALAIATPLWVAGHVGALADGFRGTQQASVAPPPGADGTSGPLATLLGLLASVSWMTSGGPSRALVLLTRTTPGLAPVGAFAMAARALADGLRIGVAAAAGVVVAAAGFEVFGAALTRVAAPVALQPALVALRPLVALLALAAALPAALALVMSAGS
jgi:type III secretory pathway component EscT